MNYKKSKSNSDINFSVLGGQIPIADRTRRDGECFVMIQDREIWRFKSVTCSAAHGAANLHTEILKAPKQRGKRSPLFLSDLTLNNYKNLSVKYGGKIWR
jgi:hypothetical protein